MAYLSNSKADLRPFTELMYMDFTLMASDQISNQAAKDEAPAAEKSQIIAEIRQSWPSLGQFVKG